MIANSGKKYQLHIAGEGPLRQALENRIRELNLNDCAFLHGHVSNPYPLLKQADLFVLPSHYEGLPNVMLEAMLCHCPILATNTQQGAGEYLRAEPLGELVPVASISGLLTAMIDRFENPNPWTARADLAYHHVQKHHNLEHWIQSLSGILLRAAQSQVP
jgi:glycosyltransferase involved in cell wall biosynthesis